MTLAEHYSYRISWANEDGQWAGTVAELPSLSWLADTQHEALSGIQSLVQDILEDMTASGEISPTPLSGAKLFREVHGACSSRITSETRSRGC